MTISFYPQFFLTEADVGGNRGEKSFTKLTELNERVDMRLHNEPLTEEVLKQFTVRIPYNPFLA